MAGKGGSEGARERGSESKWPQKLNISATLAHTAHATAADAPACADRMFLLVAGAGVGGELFDHVATRELPDRVLIPQVMVGIDDPAL